MALKNRKIRTKERGTRNNGRGRKGTRKRGGGRGMAGSNKHKKSWIIKYKPDHFGADKLASLQKKVKAINVGYVNDYAVKNNVKEVDLKALGYEKLLGGGNVTQPLNIKAVTSTDTAKSKVEQAGGSVVLAKIK